MSERDEFSLTNCATSPIEAQMNCLNPLSDRILSRDSDRQVAEIHIRLAIMNRCSAMRMAEIERVK